MRTIPIGPELLAGAVDSVAARGALWPLRVPARDVPLLDPSGKLYRQVHVPAGVRVRVRTDTADLALVVAPSEHDRTFDLVIAGELVQSLLLPAGQERVAFQATNRQADPVVAEIYLPVKSEGDTGLIALEVDEQASAQPAPDDRPRWVAYGSSITQCAAAHSPARTWPAIVARQANLNLTCLGYGGACNLEPVIAMAIRDLPADFISLKLGINVHNNKTLNAISYPPAVHGLVRTIRQRHAHVPIALISPIISPPRETKPNAVGVSIGDFRQMTRRAAIALNERGDTNLFYFDGRDLLGEDDASMLPDNLHPSPDGYELIGRRFGAGVLSRIHLPAQRAPSPAPAAQG